MAIKNRYNNRKYRSTLPLLCGRPDLTPLIDVLFLSLIFFIVSSSFIKLYGVKIDLPKTEKTQSANVEKFIISLATIENGSKIFFNDEELSLDSLDEKLADIRSISQTKIVIIAADKNTTVDILAPVMVKVERAGLSSLIVVSDDINQKETSYENIKK